MKSSLPVKFAALALIIAGIGVFGISFYSYQDAAGLLRNQSIQRLAEGMNRTTQLFLDNIQQVKTDLTAIVHSDPVQGYIRAVKGDGYDDLRNMTDKSWKERLSMNFITLLKQHPEYNKIRYIGVADNGLEIIRVQYRDDQVIAVKSKELQYKGTRYYFKETIALPAEQLFISRFDLNREYGNISFPLKPITRVAAPIYTEDGFIFGIIVINVSVDLLAQPFSNPPKNIQYFIADNLGDYIFHPDKDKRYTLALGGSAGLKKDFPEISFNEYETDEILQQEKDYLFVKELSGRNASLIIRHIHYNPQDSRQFLILAALVSHEIIEQEAKSFGVRLATGALGMVFILALAIALLATRITAPINLLTTAADRIAAGEEDVPVPSVERHDEIGNLAQSFKTMLKRLADSRNELKSLAESLEEKVQERTDELSVTLEKAEISDRTKSEFLSNMSHELRTPLNGILGYAQIFSEDDTLTEEQQAGIKVIRESGEHLLMLINDILDLSKVEAEKMELTTTTFQFPEFLENIVAIIKVKSDSKHLTFSSTFDSNLPERICTDELRLRQILLNLLSNSVKFTTKGYVLLQVKSQSIDRKNVRLTFVVEDSGIGIEATMQEKIFEPFQQVGNILQYSDGSGLGLSISQKLVKILGGDLQIKSPVNTASDSIDADPGSQFFFSITVPIIEEDQITYREKNNKSITNYVMPNAKTQNILIVDDTASNRAVLRDTLEPFGFLVQEATDGNEVLTACKKNKPDLILMDLRMPDMDGFTATKQIKEHPEFKNIPVIAISASTANQKSLHRRCLEHGFSGYILKPFIATTLLETLAKQLHIDLYCKESTSKAADNGKTVSIPPMEILNRIDEWAQIGDIDALMTEVQELTRHQSNKYSAFSAQIKMMVDGFKLSEIESYITQCRTRDI